MEFPNSPESLLEKFFEMVDERIQIMAPKLNVPETVLRDRVYGLLGYKHINKPDTKDIN